MRTCPDGCSGCSKMSQSDLHRLLVVGVLEALEARYPEVPFEVDLQRNPGDPVPPIIAGFRPDVYAAAGTPAGPVVIAEAKTDSDLDTKHTYDQVVSFVAYLEQRDNARFILSVTGCGADRAKTLLRFVRQELQVTRTSISLYDTYDFWCIDRVGGKMWHLS